MHDSPQTSFRTIDLENSEQVARLCSVYGCSEQELEEAVRMVGPRQISVEQWIRGLNSNERPGSEAQRRDQPGC